MSADTRITRREFLRTAAVVAGAAALAPENKTDYRFLT